MNHDLILGIWLGACLALVVGAKAVSWALTKAAVIILRWFERAL